MKRKLINNFLVSAMLATVIISQMTVPVLAVTDSELISSVQSGVQYLADNQNTDGSINGYGGETDWAIIAIKASGQEPDTFKSPSGSSAVDHIESSTLSPAASATDIERRMLAIASTGSDMSTFGGDDYKAKLLSQHNNDQIGDTTLLNDDIFGVIAVGVTDDEALKPMAQDALEYFISHQGVDGGFSYTTNSCPWCGSDSNDTAAAIIAMNTASKIGLTNASLVTAKDQALVYLLGTQQSDGGFGYDIYSPSDGSSTAWGLMALNSVGESVRAQASAARDWILARQNSDGGFGYYAYGTLGSDTYTTSHSILALLGTTWLLDPSPIRSATIPTVVAISNNTPKAPVQNSKAEAASLEQSNEQPTFRVLGSTATVEPQDQDKLQSNVLANLKQDNQKVASKDSKYSMYSAIALAAGALVWFGAQSAKTINIPRKI